MDIRGSVVATGCRFAIIVSRFNEEITAGLLSGARAALVDAGVSEDDVTVIHVPGAFEIPVAALHAARHGHSARRGAVSGGAAGVASTHVLGRGGPGHRSTLGTSCHLYFNKCG